MAILFTGVAGCGGGGGGGGSTVVQPAGPTLPPNVTTPATQTLQVQGVAASSVQGSVTATDPGGYALTYSVVNAPSSGTVTLDSATGNYTYTVAGNAVASSDSFKVRVANSKYSSDVVVGVTLQGDPLLGNQWHIQNTGATAFAQVLPSAGNDLNVAPVWQAGITGRGVKVGVVDSGLEIAHEDLAANVDVANSINFVTGTNDPTRSPYDPGEDHGTQVGGIIGAVAFNGKGGRGVAYNARLRGYNLLASGAGSVSNFAAAMGGTSASADNDIFNASFARTALASLQPFSGTYNTINQNFATLRGGKGAVLVNAAGNSFKEISGYPDVCIAANFFGISCHDPATDERLGGTTPIIVGAINAEGKKSSYSSTGSSLWVVAPGGEYGFDSRYFDVTGLLDPSSAVKPAIVTTARSGCGNTEYGKVMNLLDSLGSNALAPNCQYTAMMNGTSSAAPNTSAVIALMLEANPSLTNRDIKAILAKTARHVDPGFAGVSNTAIIPGTTVVLEPGWTKNAAGYWFSNWYGFGAVDANAAVAAAKALTTHMPAEQSYTAQTTSGLGATVPALDSAGYSYSGALTTGFQTVEEVVLFINIAQTPTNPVTLQGKSVSMGLQCVQIEMTSPSGTKSVMLHAATGLSNSSVSNARILTNAFYGEPANGNWKLTFFNYCSSSQGSTVLSAINPQKFIIVGH
ncbi:S8 family serine peptidase [Niveibacterium sp.]|uniref:S8 family serine peptidase n=1 Tax=Niveibacterium sp. TaxID=2017444 RepID=UPI0035B40708